MDASWADFLLSTKDFSQLNFPNDLTETETEIAIMGPGHMGFCYAVINNGEDRHFLPFPEIEKAFNALKNSESDTRLAVFKLLVDGME